MTEVGATPGDQIFASALLSAGNNYLTFPVPASSITGNSFACFRFSSAGGLSYTGLAKDGEVEDYQISIVNQPPRVDWGDAPGNSMIPNTYPTLAADNGARHIIVNNILHLGLLIDSEPDGQPDVNATGDDLNNLLDEDGVTFTSPIRHGLMATIDVVSSAVGKLDVWIDFNRDGSWVTAGDHIFVSYPLVAGTNQLTFPVPASASVGKTYGRFRLSSAGGLSYSGWAMDGEVEDYQFGIE